MKPLSKMNLKKVQKNIVSMLKKDWRYYQELVTLSKSDSDLDKRMLETIFADNKNAKQIGLLLNDVELTEDNIGLFRICGKEVYVRAIVNKLRNNFQEGIRLCLDNFKEDDAFRLEPELENHEEELIEIASDNGYVLTEDTANIANYIPAFILASMKKEPKTTLDNSGYLSDYRQLCMKNNLRFVIKAADLLRNQNVNVFEVSNYERFGILAILSSIGQNFGTTYDGLQKGESLYKYLSKNEKIVLSKFVFEKIYKECPCIIPQYLIDSNEFLTVAAEDEKERELIFRINSNSDYSLEDERLLLEKLGNNFTTLEEQIQYMAKENKDRTQMSIYELLVIPLYIKKYLNQQGISGYKINMFQNNMDSIGDIRHSKKLICFNAAYNFNFKKYLEVAMHEATHAVQFFDIENGRTEDDLLLSYEIDIVLQLILGEKYYDENYFSISYEYDAEFRAVYLTSKLCGDDEELLEKYKEFSASELKKNSEFLEKMPQVTELNYFKNSLLRKYEGRILHQGTLFEGVVREWINKGGNINSVIEDNSLLRLDYKLHPQFEQRSVEELLESIVYEWRDNADFLQKGLRLLEMRFVNNPNYYTSNKEYLENMIHDKYCPLKIKDRLKEIIQRNENGNKQETQVAKR